MAQALSDAGGEDDGLHEGLLAFNETFVSYPKAGRNSIGMNRRPRNSPGFAFGLQNESGARDRALLSTDFD